MEIIEKLLIVVQSVVSKVVIFFEYTKTLTFLNEWFLPVVVSLFFLGILLVVLHVTSETRRIRYRFITIGSHKLRTPLSKIKAAAAELIQKKEAADSREEQYVLEDYDERMLKQIAIENNRLVGLVSLLLEVTESEEGSPKYHLEKSDVVKMVREILIGYQESQWRNNLVFLEFQASEPTLFTKVDKSRISSVIQVLLENAITYSPAGGKVTVSIRKDKKGIVVDVQHSLPEDLGAVFSKS